MDADRAYMAAFLITGDRLEAEKARARHRKRLTLCPICGDGFEAGDEVMEYQNRNAHRDCVEAGAEITYTDCGLW